MLKNIGRIYAKKHLGGYIFPSLGGYMLKNTKEIFFSDFRFCFSPIA